MSDQAATNFEPKATYASYDDGELAFRSRLGDNHALSQIAANRVTAQVSRFAKGTWTGETPEGDTWEVEVEWIPVTITTPYGSFVGRCPDDEADDKRSPLDGGSSGN